MAWTTPRTWVAGEVVTAALLNTHLRDNLNAISGIWQAYTPTLGGGAAIGSGGSTSGRYAQIGKTVVFQAMATFGTSPTIPSSLSLSLPVTKTTPEVVPFDVVFIDSSPGNYYRATGRAPASASVVDFWILSTNGQFSAIATSAPFTWASGDSINLSGVYEAA